MKTKMRPGGHGRYRHTIAEHSDQVLDLQTLVHDLIRIARDLLNYQRGLQAVSA